MFDLGIGFGEMIFLAALALIVFGPEDFPKMLYEAGRLFGKIRDMSSAFKQSIDDIVHEQEIQKMRNEIESTYQKMQEEDNKLLAKDSSSSQIEDKEKDVK